jgi:hypothetical protein
MSICLQGLLNAAGLLAIIGALYWRLARDAG